MKKILLIARPSPTNKVVGDAATIAGRGFRQITHTRNAFELLAKNLDDFDVIVIDADPEIHPMGILEAVAGRKHTPPVIVLTGLEEEYMSGVVAKHGAVACVGKPFTATELAEVIDELFPNERRHVQSCDLWGHPKSVTHHILHSVA